MLSEKQLELAKTEPKEFLQQYALLRTLAEARLNRVNFWQDCETGKEYCKDCIAEAKRLVTLERDIADLITQADISDQYKTVLFLRYIEGKTVDDSARALGITRRWYQRLQAKALDAFAQAI